MSPKAGTWRISAVPENNNSSGHWSSTGHPGALPLRCGLQIINVALHHLPRTREQECLSIPDCGNFCNLAYSATSKQLQNLKKNSNWNLPFFPCGKNGRDVPVYLPTWANFLRIIDHAASMSQACRYAPRRRYFACFPLAGVSNATSLTKPVGSSL